MSEAGISREGALRKATKEDVACIAEMAVIMWDSNSVDFYSGGISEKRICQGVVGFLFV